MAGLGQMGQLRLQEVVFFDILRIMKMKTTGIFLCLMFLWTTSGHSQYLAVRGSVPLTPRTDVAISGTSAFACGANSLSIVSFFNPSSPAVTGQVAPGVGDLLAVAVNDGYAYCAGNVSGIVVIDVSDLSDPTWVRNVQAAAPVLHVSVSDTFLAVSTSLNVTLYGLRNPEQPHFLATFGRPANRVAIDAGTRKIHCAGTTGAFLLGWTVNQGVVTLSSADEFGSTAFTHVALGNSYANYIQNLQFSALNKTTYSLAGQYGAVAQITALASGSNFSVIGLATSGVEYLRQTNATPVFSSSVQTPGGVAGLAISSNEQLMVAATSAGVTIIANSPLASDPVAPLPEAFTLSAFPNPFNSRTTLSWTGSLHGGAELSVTDILGREVMRSAVPAGTNTRQLDFSGLGAGSYFVNFETPQTRSEPLRVIYLP